MSLLLNLVFNAFVSDFCFFFVNKLKLSHKDQFANVSDVSPFYCFKCL